MAGYSRSVHDAPEGAYAARAVIDASALTSIQEANLAFLALLGRGGWPAGSAPAPGLGAEILEELGRLDGRSRAALADCPYTLFDLRFADAAFWRGAAVAAVPPAESSLLTGFTRTAVFLAWHLAQSNELAASLVLGMSAPVQRLWRGMPVSSLEAVALVAAPHLTARWGSHPTFWAKLLDTAGPGGRDRGEAVRLLGLQLIAADGTWPPALPMGQVPRPA